MAGSDLVIITAGIPRKPGMSRSGVLDTNLKIIESLVDAVVRYAGDAMLLLVSNPVDVLTFRAWQRSGWERRGCLACPVPWMQRVWPPLWQ
jgi:malate dehydrogenase